MRKMCVFACRTFLILYVVPQLFFLNQEIMKSCKMQVSEIRIAQIPIVKIKNYLKSGVFLNSAVLFLEII